MVEIEGERTGGEKAKEYQREKSNHSRLQLKFFSGGAETWDRRMREEDSMRQL